jgi:hypothetical protein
MQEGMLWVLRVCLLEVFEGEVHEWRWYTVSCVVDQPAQSSPLQCVPDLESGKTHNNLSFNLDLDLDAVESG